MSNSLFDVRSAYLATREKLPDRFLFTGKIIRPDLPEGFFFYLIEVLSPWFPSTKIKKGLVHVIESTPWPAESGSPDELFERIVIKANLALDHLAKSGERDWIGNLNAVIGLISNDNIIIAQTGYILGHIFRGSKISSIIEKPTVTIPLPDETFTDITNGKLSAGDKVIFGNLELYNQLPIDRLRRFAENKGAEELVFELCRFFKKQKIVKPNAVVIEAAIISEENQTPAQEYREKYYLDEPEETIISQIIKKIQPVLSYLDRQSKVIGKKTLEEGTKLYHRSKKEFKSRYQQTHKSPFRKKISSPAGRTTSSVKVIPYHKNNTNSRPGNKEWLAKALELAKQLYGFLINPKNRRYLYAALIFLVLLVGYSKIKANNLERAQKTQEQILADSYDEAKKSFSKAKEDIALGRINGSAELIQALTLAQKSSEHGANKERSAKLITEIQASIDQMTRTSRLANLNPTFSLGNNIVDIVLVGTEIYGVNSDGRIFAADARDKEARLVTAIGKDNGVAVDMAYSKSENKIFIYTNISKVLVFDPATKTFGELKIVDGDSRWESSVAIASYVSNLYLLDNQTGEIWKHIKRDGGYSKGDDYVDSRKVNLKDAISFAVDGDIYALHSNNAVSKFIKGAYDPNFSLSGIPAPNDKIESPALLSADADSTHLFIFDKKLNRILRFSKEGAFVNQYAFDGITVENFVVNTKLQQLWVLSGGKVYEINL